MMKPILEIQQVSKRYSIHKGREPYLSLRDSLSNLLRPANRSEDFWALQDVSFNVYPGESVGVIGKNGAGKSTLLKILSKITPPTSGKIITRGRIASLLEVGTGFHPELTGRENIYLNGSILGLKRSEITKHFDAIVDFSGVDKFIDTPLKRYSSGMQLRLAFAVAAHLEPEILIIDEVLAVGDAEFQKKCLGKMNEVSKSGRTVIFVSHNMGTINQLCQKCVVLDKGRISFEGKTAEATSIYLQNFRHNESNYKASPEIPTKHENHIDTIGFLAENDIYKNSFGVFEKLNIRVEIIQNNIVEGTEIALNIFDRNQNRLLTIHEPIKATAKQLIQVELEEHQLVPGTYTLTVALHIPHQICFHLLENVCSFEIVETGSALSDHAGSDIGVFFPRYKVK